MLLVGAAVVVFGMTLGQPVTLPECGEESRTTVVCQKNWPASDGTKAMTFIEFPIAEAPEISGSATIQAYKMDGNLSGIELDTIGVLSQDRVFGLLTKKFGTPTTTNRPMVVTKAGVSVQKIVGEWKAADVYVLFDSALDNVEHGRVIILTPAEKTHRDADEKARADRRTPL